MPSVVSQCRQPGSGDVSYTGPLYFSQRSIVTPKTPYELRVGMRAGRQFKSQNIVSLLFQGPTSHYHSHPLHQLKLVVRLIILFPFVLICPEREASTSVSPSLPSQLQNWQVFSLGLTSPFVSTISLCFINNSGYLGKDVFQAQGPFLRS